MQHEQLHHGLHLKLYCALQRQPQEFQKQPADMPLTSAVWDLNHTTAPEALLQPASQLTCAPMLSSGSSSCGKHHRSCNTFKHPDVAYQ
jgi:hypothetical protein